MMPFDRVYFRAIMVLCIIASCLNPLPAADIGDLKIVRFEAVGLTMEETLTNLHQWGILVCLEKANSQGSNKEVKIALDLKDASVNEVLDAIVSEDPRYTWERYRRGASYSSLVNVFPVGSKKDPSNLLNTKVKRVTIKGWLPETAISHIDYFVPELATVLHPSGMRVSIAEGTHPSMTEKMDFEFEGITIREILNELALRTPGYGWIYEPATENSRPRWRVLY